MIDTLLNSEWIAYFAGFKRLILGLSGGLDSSVLLHALTLNKTLCDKLVVVHINHGISPQALAWQTHCEQLCIEKGLQFIAQAVEFNRQANIEEEARNARYEFFSSLMTDSSCLILAHHLDDQAETLFLQLMRGTGIDGMAGMAAKSAMGRGHLARPLLGYSRQQLEQYAQLHQLKWIEDESNLDLHYSRNFLRHQILPLLKTKWPKGVNQLAKTAAHCQEAQANLTALACLDYKDLLTSGDKLAISRLSGLDRARTSNVLRVWLKNNAVQMPTRVTFQRILDEVLCSKTDSMPLVSWGAVCIRRYKNHLILENQILVRRPSCIEWPHFPNPLILEPSGLQIKAIQTKQGVLVPENAHIQIRRRQGGERFRWHGQTKQLKKLLQDWNIPPWKRDELYLLYINDELAVVLGHEISDLFYRSDSRLLYEFQLTSDRSSRGI